jgi:hypothetical protein
MRLYFYLMNGRDFLRDESGVEVSDFAAAREEAAIALNELPQGKDFDTRDWTGWHLEITDASGVILLSIRLTCD